MRKSILIGFLACTLLHANGLVAQEDDKDKGKKEMKQDNQLPKGVVPAKPPSLAPSNRKSKPAKTSSKKPAERKLYAENKRAKREVTFETGDWIKFKMKKKDDVIKGKIEKIVPGKIYIEEKEYLLRDMEHAIPKLFSQFGKRSKGFLKIGLGVPIVAAGGAIVYGSYEIMDPNSPIVIASAFGATIGAGVVLYGVSYWHKGAKILFASRKMHVSKGWRFRAR